MSKNRLQLSTCQFYYKGNPSFEEGHQENTPVTKLIHKIHKRYTPRKQKVETNPQVKNKIKGCK